MSLARWRGLSEVAVIVHPRTAGERAVLHRALAFWFDPIDGAAYRDGEGPFLATTREQGTAWLDAIGEGRAIDVSKAQCLLLSDRLRSYGRVGAELGHHLFLLTQGKSDEPLMRESPLWPAHLWRDLTIDLWRAACRASTDSAAPAVLRAGGLSRATAADACTPPKIIVKRLKRHLRATTSGCARSGQSSDVATGEVTYRDGPHASTARRLMTVAHEVGHLLAPAAAMHDARWRRVYCALLSYAWSVEVVWDACGLRERAYQGGRDGRQGLDGRVVTALEGQERRILARVAVQREVRAAACR